jgi:hypothetical protein
MENPLRELREEKGLRVKINKKLGVEEVKSET